MTKKQDVHLLVDQEILKQWDDLSELIGVSRTAMIHNAVKIYNLFISNQLNGDKDDYIKEQLNQLQILIENLQIKKDMLTQEKDEIESSLNSIEIGNIKDFDIVAEKIIDLLKHWGAVQEVAISTHLQYPRFIIWTVLKKLKGMKKVKVEKGEWSLFNE